MRTASKRGYRELQRKLPPGWEITGTTSRGHLRLEKPGLPPVITGSKPDRGDDYRGLRNTLARLRRLERETTCR